MRLRTPPVCRAHRSQPGSQPRRFRLALGCCTAQEERAPGFSRAASFPSYCLTGKDNLHYPNLFFNYCYYYYYSIHPLFSFKPSHYSGSIFTRAFRNFYHPFCSCCVLSKREIETRHCIEDEDTPLIYQKYSNICRSILHSLLNTAYQLLSEA